MVKKGLLDSNHGRPLTQVVSQSSRAYNTKCPSIVQAISEQLVVHRYVGVFETVEPQYSILEQRTFISLPL